jgi:hypothetical protein
MSKQILIRVKATVTALEQDDAPPVLDRIRRTWWPDQKEAR